MGTEIERKFVAPQVPDATVLGPGVGLRQGYVALDGEVAVRVRITDDAATITVKAGDGLARTEVEASVSHGDAEQLWPLTAGRRIAKTRHRVDVDGGVAEVDVYDGDLAGLCTVEVEFDTEDAAAAFVAPPWFGTEVTGVPGWSNAALARDGRPIEP